MEPLEALVGCGLGHGLRQQDAERGRAQGLTLEVFDELEEIGEEMGRLKVRTGSQLMDFGSTTIGQ